MSFSTNLYRFYIITIQYKILKGAFSRTSESSFLGSRDAQACRPLSVGLFADFIPSLGFPFFAARGEKCHSPAIGYLVIVWLVTECETTSHLRFPHWILRYQHSQVSTSQWSILSSTYHMELTADRNGDVIIFQVFNRVGDYSIFWMQSVAHDMEVDDVTPFEGHQSAHGGVFTLDYKCLNVRVKNNINVDHPSISTTCYQMYFVPWKSLSVSHLLITRKRAHSRRYYILFFMLSHVSK